MEANSTIWHVRVFEPDKIEHYYFRYVTDVIASIHTTWSKKPDSIKVVTQPMSIKVISTDLLARTELIAESMTIGQLIQDKPTHF